MKPELHTLEARQQELVKMIFSIQAEPQPVAASAFDRGLKIYRNNLLMTATRSLSLSYPVLEKMLGKDAIRVLARDLLQRSPPRTGDWAEWGGGLAERLSQSPLIEAHPYLPDIAHLEWLVHQASRAESPPLVLAELSRLSEQPAENVRFRLAPSIALLKSDFPVDLLWQAHQPQDEEFELDAPALATALSKQSGPCTVLVFQQNQVARVKRLSEAEYRWVHDMAQANSLAELLDRHPDFDFINWLSQAIKEGLLEGLY